MKAQVIIYGLIDPRDGLIYYVGQSVQGLKRARRHYSPGALSRDAGTPKGGWLRGLLATGVLPEPVILEIVKSKDQLATREAYWIDSCRVQNPNLTNVSAKERARSRVGRQVSEETKRRLSLSTKKRFEDPAERKYYSQLFKGRVFSEETRQRMRTAQQQRMQNIVQRRQLANARTRAAIHGPHTPEQRLRMARARGARPFTDQFGNRYDSVREAGRQLGVDSSAISAVLKGRLSHTKGYIFKYLEETCNVSVQ